MIDRRALLATGVAAFAAGSAFAAGAKTTVTSEDGRQVDVWTWSPTRRSLAVIHFSHGAKSSPQKYDRLIGPWVAAGYKVIAPLHVDSTDHPDTKKYGFLDGWKCRLFDMRAVATMSAAASYIAAGHSYGALTALTLGGVEAVSPAGWSSPMRDERATCVVAFSPPGPNPVLDPREGFRHLAVPALIETGDIDVVAASMGGDGHWQPHLTAYVEAPAGDKYALVLDGVDHYFGNLICSPERNVAPQTPGLNRAVKVSTEFLNAYGANQPAAKLRLDRPVPPGSGYTLTLK